MNMSGGSIVWILDADSGKFSQALVQAEGQAKSTASAIDKDLSNASDSATKRLSTLGKSVAQVGWSAFNVGVAGATTALGALVAKGLSSGLELQSLQIQMNGLTKSMQLGKEAMAGAYEYAKRAPFQLPEVAQTTKTLIAFGMSTKDAVKNLDLLGNISITSGVGLSHIGSIFGRVAAQGRLMGGDIQQLTENGIAVLPALQKALGKTADQVREMASDGEISFDVFRKAMESIVDPKIVEQLNNTLPRQLDRLGGSVRILSGALVGYSVDAKDGFKLMENSIVQSATTLVKNVADTLRAQPILDAANKFGQTLSPYIDKIAALFKMPDTGGLSAAGKVLEGFFNFITEMGPLVIPLLGGLAISSTQFLQNIPLVGAALSPIGESFNQAALGALSLLNPLNAFKSSGEGARGGILSVSSAVDGATGAFDALKGRASGILESFGNIGNVFGNARNSVGNFGFALKETGKNFGFAATAIPGVSDAVETMTGKWWGARDSVGGFIDRFNPTEAILNRGKGAISSVGDKLGFLGTGFDFVKGKVGLFGDLLSPLTNLLPSFSSVLGGAGNALGIYGQALAGAGGALSSIIGIFGKAALAVGGVGLVFGAAAIGLGVLADSMGMNSEQMGKYITDTVMNIINGLQGFLAKLPSVLDSFASNISTYIPIIIDAISLLIDGIINALATSGPAIVTAALNVVETLANTFLTNLPKLIDAGFALMNFLVEGIIKALPQVIQTLVSVGTMLIDTLGQTIPKVIQAGADILLALVTGILENLPTIINGITTLISTLAKTISEMLPKLVETGMKLIDGIVEGLIQNLPAIIEALTTLATTIVTSLVTILPKLLEAGLKILLGIIEGILKALPTIIPAIVNMVTTIITALVQALPKLLEAGIKILMAIIQGIVDNLPAIIDAINILITTLLQALVDNLPMIIEGAVTLITTLAESMGTNLPIIVDAMIKIIIALVQVILQNLPLLIQAAVEIIVALVVGLVKAIPKLLGAVKDIGVGILKGLWEAVKGIGEVGGNIVKGLWDGMNNMKQWAIDKIKGLGKAIVDGLKGFLGIKSPSRVFMGIGDYMMQGLGKGIEDSTSGLLDMTKNLAERIGDNFSRLDGTNLDYKASLSADLPGEISGLSQTINGGYQYDGATGIGNREVAIYQTNNINTEVDMEQVNRDLAWDLAKA